MPLRLLCGYSFRESPIGRIYTIKQTAEILQISVNEATKLFESEPGVRDLAPVQFFGRRRKRMLRIPEEVLLRVWTRAEIRPTSAAQIFKLGLPGFDPRRVMLFGDFDAAMPQ